MINPHGSSDALPYGCTGSGGLDAEAILEQEYRDNMSKEEAMELIARAVVSGITSDLGSGSNVNLVFVGKEGVQEQFKDYRNLMAKLY